MDLWEQRLLFLVDNFVLMRTLFLLLLTSSFTYSFAQEQSETVEYKKVLIGLNVSPDYSYRTLSNNDGSRTSSLIIDIRDSLETAKLGYTVGLNFIYNFNKRIGISTGLLISNKGYKSVMTGLAFDNLSAGFDVSSTRPKNIEVIDNYYYFDIPIKGVVSFGKGSFRFIASIGITTNFLLNSNTVLVVDNVDGSKTKTTTPTGGFNRFNVSPQISLGVEKRIKNRSFIRIEPIFKYGVLKIIDAPITANLWSAGFNISYYFALK